MTQLEKAREEIRRNEREQKAIKLRLKHPLFKPKCNRCGSPLDENGVCTRGKYIYDDED